MSVDYMPPATMEPPEDKHTSCCTKCLALTGTLAGLSAACSEEGYPYWSSKGELSSSAQQCSLCKVIWQSRSWRSTTLLGSLRIHADVEVFNHEEAADSLDIEHPLKGCALSRFKVRDSGNLKVLTTLHASTPQGQ